MTDPDELIDAILDGRSAALAGLDRSDCPYPPGTALGNAWRKGWDSVNKGVSNG